MPQPCVLYARASTSKVEQAKSVPDQLAECRRYASRLGLRVVAEYRDEGVSGRKGRDQRAGWDQMLRWIEAGGLRQGGVVLTWDLDRWSRDFADGLIEALQLHKRGVSIADTKDGIVGLDTLVGQVMLALKVAGAAEYSQKLSRAVKRGIQSRVAQGFWMWPAPYGFQSRQGDGGKELIPHPEQAPHVLEMYEWADRGETPIAIARRLNLAGVLPKRGREWTAASVRRVISSACYGGRIHRRTTGEELPGRITPFLPADLWQRVRGRFLPGRRPPGARPRHYPLSGLVICGSCGRTCHIQGTVNGRYRWTPRYACPGYARGTCSNRAKVKVDELEAAVLAWWRGLMDAGEVDRLARVAVEREYAQALAAARERGPLDAELADLDRQEGRLIELHAAGGSTELTVQRLRQLQERRETVRARVRNLGADVTPMPLEDAMHEAKSEFEAVKDVRELRPHIEDIKVDERARIIVAAFGAQAILMARAREAQKKGR